MKSLEEIVKDFCIVLENKQIQYKIENVTTNLVNLPKAGVIHKRVYNSIQHNDIEIRIYLLAYDEDSFSSQFEEIYFHVENNIIRLTDYFVKHELVFELNSLFFFLRNKQKELILTQ